MPAPTLFATGAEQLAAAARRSLVGIRSHNGGCSGAVWTSDGLIITNHHVVPGELALVELHDGRTFESRVARRDAEHDLAALRIDATDLEPVEPRESPLRPGELVFAVGNPWGERAVVTAGVVFAAGGDVVRADVRLAPGNSGGPLVDAHGRTVGINSMIAGGMGIAIPVRAVQALIAAAAPPEPGFLGITIAPIALPRAIAASYPAGDGNGLLLTGIEPASPADAAGLLPGDLLLGVDGNQGLEAIGGRLRAMRAGRKVRLSLLRAGAPIEIETTPA